MTITPPQLLEKGFDCAAFLAGKSAVLLPEGYEKFCSDDTLQQLQRFGRERRLILCSYRVDEGSLMYLEERIDRLRERKKI